MPIDRLLAESDLTPEQRQVISVAFGQVLHKLGLVDRNDPICDMVARKVIEVAQAGTSNAVAVAEKTFRHFQ
jgi:lipopolysaccharide biosynthesis regulator YciM